VRGVDKLTEIKQYRADVIFIEQEDIDWLIEQAEKVEEYEKVEKLQSQLNTNIICNRQKKEW
jgi:hypothetical protein